MTDRREWKVGLSCGLVSPAKLRRAQKVGLDCIEIGGIEEGCYWKDLRKWEEEIGVKAQSYHLPYHWVSREEHGNDPVAYNRGAWEKSLSYCIPAIEQAGQAGVGIFVTHTSMEPNPEEGEVREKILEVTIEYCNRLSEVCKANGAVLAVEDLPRTCIANDVREMQAIMASNDDLRICFDVNHLLKGNHVDYVKALGDRIVTTHISGYDFVNERHLMPRESRWDMSGALFGKGGFYDKIDWGALQRALEEADYKGAWMYEVNMGYHPWEEIRVNRESLLDL